MEENPYRFPPNDVESAEPLQPPVRQFSPRTRAIFRNFAALCIFAMGAYAAMVGMLKLWAFSNSPGPLWIPMIICVFGAGFIWTAILLRSGGYGKRILGMLYFFEFGMPAAMGWAVLVSEPSFDKEWFFAMLVAFFTFMSFAGLIAAIKHWKPNGPACTQDQETTKLPAN